VAGWAVAILSASGQKMKSTSTSAVPKFTATNTPGTPTPTSIIYGAYVATIGFYASWGLKPDSLRAQRQQHKTAVELLGGIYLQLLIEI